MTSKKPTQRITFTENALRRLSTPQSGRLEIYDKRTPGLSIRITTGGKISFVVRRRVNGKPSRFTLGGYPALSIAEARRLTVEANAEMNRGIDPSDLRRAKRAESRRKAEANITLETAWIAYRDDHLIPNCSIKTAENDRYFFDACGSLKSRRLDDIEAIDLKNLQRRIVAGTGGGVMANRTLTFLRRLLNYAADELNWGGSFPATLRKSNGKRRASGGRGKTIIVLAAEESRKRFLSPDEKRKLLEALRDEPDRTMRDCILILIFAGQRRSTTESMAWADLNLIDGIWTVPQGTIGQKGAEGITFPLNPPTLAILRSRRELIPESEKWVFPSTGSLRSKTGHISKPDKVWRKIRDRAGLKDFHLHDFRRSFAVELRAAGGDRPLISFMLGHTPGSTATMIYDVVGIDAGRPIGERASTALLESTGVDIASLTTPVVKSGDD